MRLTATVGMTADGVGSLSRWAPYRTLASEVSSSVCPIAAAFATVAVVVSRATDPGWPRAEHPTTETRVRRLGPSNPYCSATAPIDQSSN